MNIKDVSERLTKRVDELIALGNKVLGTRYDVLVGLEMVKHV